MDEATLEANLMILLEPANKAVETRSVVRKL